MKNILILIALFMACGCAHGDKLPQANWYIADSHSKFNCPDGLSKAEREKLFQTQTEDACDFPQNICDGIRKWEEKEMQSKCPLVDCTLDGPGQCTVDANGCIVRVVEPEPKNKLTVTGTIECDEIRYDGNGHGLECIKETDTYPLKNVQIHTKKRSRYESQDR